MATYNLIENQSGIVKGTPIENISNYVVFLCTKDFRFFYNNKNFRLKEGDTVIAENTEPFRKFSDKLVPISDPSDIISLFMLSGKDGYVEAKLDKSDPNPSALIYNPVTKKLEFSSAGIGGGGAVSVEDEGLLVNADTRTLNFIGADVVAIQDGTDVDQVNIYIPTPSFVSHFNTNDSSLNSAIATGISSTSRHISAPTAPNAPFDIGTWLGHSVHNAHNSGAILVTTAGSSSFCDDSTTTFNVDVFGADGVTVIANHNVLITGNTDDTANGIRIRVVGWLPDSSKFRGDVSVDIDLTAIIPNGGRYSYTITHTNLPDGVYTYSQNNLFYDIDDTAATTTTPTIAETAGNVYRQISGVYYFTTGNQFTVNIADIDNINSDSYPANILRITGSAYGLPTLNVPAPDLTGWTSQHDDIDSSYTKTDWSISAIQFCSVNGNAFISSQALDWTNEAIKNSTPDAIALNTYTDNSTAIYEDFRLETRRLTIGHGAWDNTQDLNGYDGGSGLQYRCSRLIYPTDDYTGFDPNGGLQPDYSGMIGMKEFHIEFNHAGISHSNGQLRFGDTNITEAMLTASDVIIDVSLDAVNWYHLNADYLGGPLADGDGCRVNPLVHSLSTDSILEFTLGTGGFTNAGTGLAGFGIFIRIYYADTANGRNAYLGELEMINWV